MKPLKELFPDCDREGLGYFDQPSYTQMVESLDHRILATKDEGNYQGETFVLLRREDGCPGFLQYSWGSCGHCDSLQATRSYEELEGLRDGFVNSIHWAPSDIEMAAWLSGKDWDSSFGYGDGGKEFLTLALEALS